MPWPDQLEGLGERAVRPIEVCVDCPADARERTTFIQYGGTPLCRSHAWARTGHKVVVPLPERPSAERRTPA